MVNGKNAEKKVNWTAITKIYHNSEL